MNKKEEEQIINNFILFYTSDEKERERMKEVVTQYLDCEYSLEVCSLCNTPLQNTYYNNELAKYCEKCDETFRV